MEESKKIQTLIDLEGKVALIIGAGRGIGKEIASFFAQARAKVIITSRTIDELVKTHDWIKDEIGVEICYKQVDSTDCSQIDSLFSWIDDSFHGLDILVNVAGTSGQIKAEDFKPEDFDRIYGLNCKGLFYSCGKAHSLLLKKGGGKIINIASHLGVVGLPLRTIYCSSKAAVIHYSKTLAAEWAKDHINVNCIAPGYTATELAQKVLKNPEFKAEVLSKTPIGFIGHTEDIAGAALYLASSSSRYMTGQTMVIDGGWSCV